MQVYFFLSRIKLEYDKPERMIFFVHAFCTLNLIEKLGGIRHVKICQTSSFLS